LLVGRGSDWPLVQCPAPTARTRFVLYLVEAHIALNAIGGRASREFFNFHCSGDISLDRTTVRADTLDVSAFVREEIFSRVDGVLLTLIMDGASHGGRVFYPLMIFSMT
jgi:hypothetical protein